MKNSCTCTRQYAHISVLFNLFLLLHVLAWIENRESNAFLLCNNTRSSRIHIRCLFLYNILALSSFLFQVHSFVHFMYTLVGILLILAALYLGQFKMWWFSLCSFLNHTIENQNIKYNAMVFLCAFVWIQYCVAVVLFVIISSFTLCTLHHFIIYCFVCWLNLVGCAFSFNLKLKYEIKNTFFISTGWQ